MKQERILKIRLRQDDFGRVIGHKLIDEEKSCIVGNTWISPDRQTVSGEIIGSGRNHIAYGREKQIQDGQNHIKVSYKKILQIAKEKISRMKNETKIVDMTRGYN